MLAQCALFEVEIYWRKASGRRSCQRQSVAFSGWERRLCGAFIRSFSLKAFQIYQSLLGAGHTCCIWAIAENYSLVHVCVRVSITRLDAGLHIYRNVLLELEKIYTINLKNCCPEIIAVCCILSKMWSENKRTFRDRNLFLHWQHLHKIRCIAETACIFADSLWNVTLLNSWLQHTTALLSPCWLFLYWKTN